MSYDFEGEPPKRGEIFWADLNPARGSEQAGRRPVLVISPDNFNRAMKVVVVAAITTTIRDSVREGRSPVCVFLPKDEPLKKESTVLGFQVLTLAHERLDAYEGELTAEQMRDVDRAVAASFGLANWTGRAL